MLCKILYNSKTAKKDFTNVTFNMLNSLSSIEICGCIMASLHCFYYFKYSSP